uniref:Coiled-coil domain-containing protein 86 n=1 Tax=Nannospalax galili TaxID=1026970 RepID=A0A8C6QZG8_NANGA
MDTLLRRSQRLEGLSPQSSESLPVPEASRARWALVTLESNPEETSEPRSPLQVEPPRLACPQRQPETSPGSLCVRQGAGVGSPPRQPDPRSPQPNAGLESPATQPEYCPPFPHRAESPEPSPTQGEPDSEVARGKEELTPGSPKPCPGLQASGPEPSRPAQELTSRAPGSPQRPPEPTKPPLAGKTATSDLSVKKGDASSPQTPASKKRKKAPEGLPVIPKGKPKSGRVWKDRSKKRFSQMVQDKPLRTSWQRKMKERQEKKLAKDFARHLEEEKQRRRQEKKERRAENLRRRLENERKAEIVQVIRNPAKLKRAKKKQLRAIEKRDTLSLLQKQPPQRPAAKV